MITNNGRLEVITYKKNSSSDHPALIVILSRYRHDLLEQFSDEHNDHWPSFGMVVIKVEMVIFINVG